MRPLQQVLGASTLVLAIASGSLWQHMCRERERADLEASARGERELEIDALQRRVADLEGALRRQRQDTGGATSAVGTASPGQPAAAPPVVSLLGAPSALGIPSGLRRMGVLRTYGDLARELKLSPAETNVLFDLLLDEDEASLGRMQQLPSDPTELRAHLALLESRKETAIEEAFGPDKAEAYRSYRKSLNQRAELQQIREHFDALGTPVNDAQRKQLLTILIDEQRAQDDALQAERPRDYAQVQAARADMQRRVRERAAQVLDPDQRERLDEYYAMQTASMPAAVTAQRSR